MTWLYLRISALSDSISRLLKQPITSTLHILGMGIALSIPMGCYVLLDGADQFSRKLNNSTQLNVFLKSDDTNDNVKIAEKKLSELPKNFIVFATTSQFVETISSGLQGIKAQNKKNIPTNITTIKHFKVEETTNFLSYGSSSKNLYLLLLEDL